MKVPKRSLVIITPSHPIIYCCSKVPQRSSRGVCAMVTNRAKVLQRFLGVRQASDTYHGDIYNVAQQAGQLLFRQHGQYQQHTLLLGFRLFMVSASFCKPFESNDKWPRSQPLEAKSYKV